MFFFCGYGVLLIITNLVPRLVFVFTMILRICFCILFLVQTKRNESPGKMKKMHISSKLIFTSKQLISGNY